MASLYSAQAVITAREQLNHELAEKAASDHSTPENLHKTDKHNPYHYHETVHEKCKHHGDEKESTLHKKLHEKIDQAKPKEQHEVAHEGLASSGPGAFRRILNQRAGVEDEMKAWARVIQKCLKGEHKLSEKQMHEQHAGFYKWLLFIEELFHHYEGSLKTQTSIHALEQQEETSAKSLEEAQSLLSSHRLEHKSKEGTQGLKFPHIMTRQRMQFLQARVSQLEKQLEASQAHNRDYMRQAKELTTAMEGWEQKERIRTQRVIKMELSVKDLLSEMEQFNKHLLEDLSDPERLKTYPKNIQTNLSKINELRKSLDRAPV